MRNKANLIYVIAYQYGVDVTSQTPPRTSTHTWAYRRYTPGYASVGQETLFPVSCSSRHCSKPIPALYRWWSAVKVYSVSHACYTSAAQDHPTTSAYKNNLTPIQFVSASTQCTKCIHITKTYFIQV